MLLLVLCILALGQIALGQSPLVTTTLGTMKGKVLKSRDGRDYFSFTKVPFAKPPVGDRRFMISEKADNWTGILDATQEIPSCFQQGEPQPFGQEDCLYLNVFTPNLTGNNPVIFSIFGGAFIGGSARSFGSGSYFMDEDVVFVGPNYRVGPLGFLSLENDVIPGNMGLKDQALALEWVHREISAFGGDPNRIMVMGVSSGGASADIICTVPRTNGIIKACLTQSGFGSSVWAIMKPGLAREMAMNMAKTAGCADSKDILKCLQNKPVEVIGNFKLMVDNNNKINLPTPLLESASAPGAILTSWPTSTNHNYPWMFGVCQDEGLVMTTDYEAHLKTKEETDKFINSFNETITSYFHLENRVNDVQRMRERYFTNGTEPLKAIRNFYTDYYFLYPAMKSISRHSGPTYFYKFNYTNGPPSNYTKGGIKAAPHGGEMPYLYGPPTDTRDWPKPEDVKLSKMLIKMLVNFARDQTPSIQGTMQWPQFQGQYFLDIQDTGVQISNFTQYQELLDFWKSYIPEESKLSKSSSIHSPLFFIALICISYIFKGVVL